MEMFYRWRILWLILLAVAIANVTQEVKAFPVQNTSTPTLTLPNTILPNRRTVMTSVFKSNTQASKILPTPYQSQSRSIAVNSSSPTMKPQVTVSSMSNTQASKIPPTPYQRQSPTLSPTVTTRSIAVNSSSPTMKAPITDTRPVDKKNPKLIRFIGIGIGTLVVIIIIVVLLCKLRRKVSRRSSKSPTSQRAFDNSQFENDESQDSRHIVLSDYQDPSYSPRTNFGITLEDGIHSTTGRNKKERVIRTPQPKRSSWKSGIRAKEVINVDGGTLETDHATLRIGPGCLGEATPITMLMDNDNFAFKSLVDLGLLKRYPRVIEFLPDGLKFKKLANLTVHLENLVSPELELFVLHGSYDSEMERTIWNVLTDDINANGQYVDMKINGFCFFTYIMAKRGKLARILSHLNHSFDCYAMALYRRMPSSPNIDIAVVLVSKFGENPSPEVTKLIDENKFCKGEVGAVKRVDTHRSLEMCLEFPGLPEKKSYKFKIEVSQFDSCGMVIDYFREIAQAFPAKGKVVIHEIGRKQEKLLWTLNIHEEIGVEEPAVTVTGVVPPESEPEASDDSTDAVVMRTTKLGGREINRLSQIMGVDWDSLAGLMDIPYEERVEIRLNDTTFSDKAKMILSKFNESTCFCRNLLKKYLVKIGRDDVAEEMTQLSCPIEPQQSDEPQSPENGDNPNNNIESEVVLRDTRLSSREMYRLSLEIIDWASLAGLMDITMPVRESMLTNPAYPDLQSRAEKVLSIFSKREHFCREKLADHLKGIGLHNLVNVVETGKYRDL